MLCNEMKMKIFAININRIEILQQNNNNKNEINNNMAMTMKNETNEEERHEQKACSIYIYSAL